jgi:hypothetical protein
LDLSILLEVLSGKNKKIGLYFSDKRSIIVIMDWMLMRENRERIINRKFMDFVIGLWKFTVLHQSTIASIYEFEIWIKTCKENLKNDR